MCCSTSKANEITFMLCWKSVMQPASVVYETRFNISNSNHMLDEIQRMCNIAFHGDIRDLEMQRNELYSWSFFEVGTKLNYTRP